MKARLGIIAVLLVLIFLFAIHLLFFKGDGGTTSVVRSFDECLQAGYEVMESYPRQCRDAQGTVFKEEVASPASHENVPTMTQSEARVVANQSVTCSEAGTVTSFETYNQNSGTWWYTLDTDKLGCSPACVVSEQTKEAEVNWRCTGAVR